MAGDLYERLREMRRRGPVPSARGEVSAPGDAPRTGERVFFEGATGTEPHERAAGVPPPPGEGWAQVRAGVYRRRTTLPLDHRLWRGLVPGQAPPWAAETTDYGWAPTHPALRPSHGASSLSDGRNESARQSGVRAASSPVAVFLDVETSARSTGAGSVAFLIGVARARIEAGLIDVTQLLLADLGAEPVLLDAVDQEIRRLVGDRGPPLYVTYNGASFDLPVLRSRAIMNRRRFRDAEHLDLLPIARRLYRDRIGSCSLGRVERLVLGIQRTEDVPSAEVPQRFQRYLASQNPEVIAAVCSHHCYDVATLAVLARFLEALLDFAPDSHRGLGCEPDRFSLATLLAGRGGEGASDRVVALLEAERAATANQQRERTRLAHRAGLTGRLARQPGRRWVRVREMLARAYRRRHDLDRLRGVLQELVDHRGARSETIALAVVLEKRLVDLDAALEVLDGWLAEHPQDAAARRRRDRVRRRCAGRGATTS